MKHVLLCLLSTLLLGACTQMPEKPQEPVTSAKWALQPDSPSATNKAAQRPEPAPESSPRSAPKVLAFSSSLSAAPSRTTELHRDRPGVLTMDLTSQSTDIWSRMRRGFAMPDLSNPLVDKHIAAFTVRPQAVSAMLERGRKYLYHIVSELEKRGMPTELALLPLVESAYNPMAYSSAKAAGLWQFIPSTGKDFQLQQNWWVDERRDVLASTNAALKYLQAVYELQGDWHLALASYNWGENAVLRAVNANRNAGKETDFNNLRMPRETQQYVPKLQAIKMIVAHPERYGVTLPKIPNEPYFVTVERDQGIDLAVAARLAEMPLEEFKALNPAYNRPVIPGNHDADLLLPVENARKFRENLAAHAGQPLINWKTYTLPRASRIEDVAKHLRIPADTLRAANGIKARARLAAGYTLLVPRHADTARIEVSAEAPKRKVRQTQSRSPSKPVANAGKAKPRS